MAKRKRKNGRAKRRAMNGVVVAMQRRFGSQGNHTHTDKRKRRRDRNAWRKDHADD